MINNTHVVGVHPLQKHRMSFRQTYRSLFLLCPNPRKHYCPIRPKKRLQGLKYASAFGLIRDDQNIRPKVLFKTYAYHGSKTSGYFVLLLMKILHGILRTALNRTRKTNLNNSKLQMARRFEWFIKENRFSTISLEIEFEIDRNLS